MSMIPVRMKAGPKHAIEHRQCEFREHRVMSELVAESDRDARVICQRVGLDAHVDHHAACIRLTGRRINQRHCNGFVRSIFLNAHKQGTNTKPQAQR